MSAPNQGIFKRVSDLKKDHQSIRVCELPAPDSASSGEMQMISPFEPFSEPDSHHGRNRDQAAQSLDRYSIKQVKPVFQTRRVSRSGRAL